MSGRGLARGGDVRLCRDLHVCRGYDIQIRIVGERSGVTVDAVIVSGVFPGMTSPVYPEGTVALVKEPRARA